MRQMPAPSVQGRVFLNLMQDFELWCAGEPVRIAPSAQRVVGFVALHDRPVRRTRVSGVLWPDATEERASASLRSALWRIRTPTGTPVVTASSTHVSLGPEVEVDFRAAVDRAHALLDDGDVDVAAIDLTRELCSYGDDLLPGWYDDWVLLERERFHHMRLQALDRLAERLSACGRLCDALQVALSGVHAEPLRETSHRIVVQIHLEQGNVAEAVRQYRRYEQALQEELGARPSAGMRRLVNQCLRLSDREVACSSTETPETGQPPRISSGYAPPRGPSASAPDRAHLTHAGQRLPQPQLPVGAGLPSTTGE